MASSIGEGRGWLSDNHHNAKATSTCNSNAIAIADRDMRSKWIEETLSA